MVLEVTTDGYERRRKSSRDTGGGGEVDMAEVKVCIVSSFSRPTDRLCRVKMTLLSDR